MNVFSCKLDTLVREDMIAFDEIYSEIFLKSSSEKNDFQLKKIFAKMKENQQIIEEFFMGGYCLMD